MQTFCHMINGDGILKRLKSSLRTGLVAGTALLMLTLCFAALSHPASAALTPEWTYETPMGGPRTFPVIVQDDEGLVYVMGGVLNGTSWVSVPLANSYDSTTGAWSTLAPMVEGLRWATGALGHDGKVYVVAGWNDTHAALYAPVQIYDPVDDSWSTGASIPLPVSFACAVTLDDGLIYVVGGRDAAYNAVANVQVYDPVSDSWSSTTSMPAGRYGGSAVEWRDTIIYTGGTLSGSVHTAETWIFYPGYGWYSLPSMPSTKYLHASVVGGDDNVYVMGGDGESAPSATGYVYNYFTNEWNVLPDLNFAMTYVSSAASAPDGRILVLGGTDMSVGARATNRVESLQIMTESITLTPSTVDQGGTVLVTVAYDYAYATPVDYELMCYLLADGVAYNPTYVYSPLPGTFSFEVSIPQQVPAGTHEVVLQDLYVEFEAGGVDYGTKYLALTVLSSLTVEEQIAALQADIDALDAALAATDADVDALTMQVAVMQAKLDGIIAGMEAMGATSAATTAALNATLADLQAQLDDFQEQIDRVEDKADTAGTYGIVTMVLVIIIVVLVALMLVMARKKA